MPSPFILLQRLLPLHTLTHFAGKLAVSEQPWLRDRLIQRVAAAYGVHMSEAARGFEQFASFSDFSHANCGLTRDPWRTRPDPSSAPPIAQ